MGQVQLSVNGRPYGVACDDGQEAHIERLGRVINEKVDALTKSLGQIGETRLLLMASLIIADELAEAHDALGEARRATVETAQALQRQIAMAGAPTMLGEEPAMMRSLHALADRIESIAEALEQD